MGKENPCFEQETHINNWLEAERLRTTVFEQARIVYGALRRCLGDSEDRVQKVLDKIETNCTTKAEIREFISVVDSAVRTLFGVERKDYAQAIGRLDREVASFGEAMERFDLLTRMLRKGNPTVVQAALGNRPNSQPTGEVLDWKGAMAVFEAHPDLFGIEEAAKDDLE